MTRYIRALLTTSSLLLLGSTTLPNVTAQETPAPLFPGKLDLARVSRMVDSRLATARRSFETMLSVQATISFKYTAAPAGW